jgi:hypothetical protein
VLLTKFSTAQSSQGRYLIGPVLDPLFLGGASIGFALVFQLAVIFDISLSMAWCPLAFGLLIGQPHFIASYHLLYVDSCKKIFRDPLYFWVGVVFPLFLFGALFLTYVSANPLWIGRWANIMFFFLGWHYVKQVLGCVAVTNALQKFYYSRFEFFALKASLIALWALAWINQNVSSGERTRWGFKYFELGLPSWSLHLSYGLVFVSLTLVILSHVKKYLRDKSLPAFSAIASYISIYVWFVPLFFNPFFTPLISFFHSLQYLVFVYAYRRNRIRVELKSNSYASFSPERLWKINISYYLILVLVGGAAFSWAPKFIDSLLLLDSKIYGKTAFVFAFATFLNIHHYFIDNVLWRGDSSDIRAYLTPQARDEQRIKTFHNASGSTL